MSVGLILGKMPKNCGHCQLTHKYYELHCIGCDGIDGTKPNNADDGLIGIYYDDGPYEYEIYERKPDWCPLQEVEPTRYAEWLYVDEYDDLRRCSECDHVVKEGNISQYCPHCGAKMDGGAE